MFGGLRIATELSIATFATELSIAATELSIATESIAIDWIDWATALATRAELHVAPHWITCLTLALLTIAWNCTKLGSHKGIV